DHNLRTGDTVEILTPKHSYGPSQHWVKLAQSSQAKHKISQSFKKQRREENVEKAREMVQKEIKHLDVELKDVLKPE
ncbi:bifunctional (p)ppGpp synthetase/guanosine-3',5'-bis(diphosphate) 3'-pyrophosphohydrolase, partial [Bacillus subtilis]